MTGCSDPYLSNAFIFDVLAMGAVSNHNASKEVVLYLWSWYLEMVENGVSSCFHGNLTAVNETRLQVVNLLLDILELYQEGTSTLPDVHKESN